MRRAREELAVFLLAVQFLTRCPVPFPDLFTEARLTAATRYYPLVGALVGAVAGAVFSLAHLVFPVTLALVLATAASLWATGAFHEDGFADACDGLGGGADREQALEIMRDSRLGAYGAAGLGLMLAAKVLALAAAPAVVIPWLLVAAHAASRASAVLAIATGSYVRAAGAAKPVADGVAPGGLAAGLGDRGRRRRRAVDVRLAGRDDRRIGRARGRASRHARCVRAQAGRLYRRLPRGRAADQRTRALPGSGGGPVDGR